MQQQIRQSHILSFHHDSYDATPSDYVSMIISDYGMVSVTGFQSGCCLIIFVLSFILSDLTNKNA